MPPPDPGEEGPVEGELTEEGKAQHPQGVFPEVVGVHEPLHQQEAVDGKGQPPRQPHHKIQPDAALPDGILPEQAVFQQSRADVVDEHGQAGDALQRRAAEGRPRAGKCVVLHFVRPHI